MFVGAQIGVSGLRATGTEAGGDREVVLEPRSGCGVATVESWLRTLRGWRARGGSDWLPLVYVSAMLPGTRGVERAGIGDFFMEAERVALDFTTSVELLSLHCACCTLAHLF